MKPDIPAINFYWIKIALLSISLILAFGQKISNGARTCLFTSDSRPSDAINLSSSSYITLKITACGLLITVTIWH